MALLQNGTLLAQYPFRLTGGGVAADVVVWNRGDRCNRFTGETYVRTAATPNGHLPPSAWVLPVRAGGLASYLPIQGAGGIAFAQLAAGLNAQAALGGAGDITAAALALVTSAVATLSGSGSLSGALVGRLEAAAALAGSGNVSGAIGALASLIASLAGTGALSGQPYARGFMAANIRGYGDLTPEGLRDAVWSAASASYNAAGTMGAKVNAAAAGGVDLEAMAAAVWAKAIENGMTAEQVLRVLLAPLAGKATGIGTGVETYLGQDGTTPRVVATFDAQGNRTAVAVTP